MLSFALGYARNQRERYYLFFYAHVFGVHLFVLGSVDELWSLLEASYFKV